MSGFPESPLGDAVPVSINTLVEDPSPQLGNDLDCNGHAINSPTDPIDEHGVGDRGYNDIRRLTKLSTTLVAFNTTGQTTLYTVSAGKIFIPIMIIIRAGANAGATDVTFGRVGALTDWQGTKQLDNLDADGDQVKIEVTNANPPILSKTYAAGVVFQIDVTVAQGGATNYVDLFGYLVDA